MGRERIERMEKMYKHTKGPWKVVQSIENNVTFDIDDANGHEIVREVQPGDASLIAAAPELLEAAKRILHHIEVCSPDDCDQWDEVVKQLQDSVAKAKGETE